jgi:Xaa-Pro aminopeptidase
VNRDVLRDGQLLLLDAACEVAYYTADVTRTFPVSGRFTDAQREVYGWVLKAQLAAIDACRTGRRFSEVHDAAVRVLTEGMVALGLLEGPVEARIEDETFKRYYMHGTSHWLGLDVHDVGSYGREGRTRSFEPGMVLTVEPGLYVDPDDATAPERLRGIGIRIEDDVLVTDGDPDVLTAAIPKTIADVEAACAG